MEKWALPLVIAFNKVDKLVDIVEEVEVEMLEEGT